ncbi:MAG: alpha/beta hydrolase [Pleurocapsa sp. MO_192.B19]|nr:alpha/beta hydrolase [Pleurocapsa sp. MO_192.B19]
MPYFSNDNLSLFYSEQGRGELLLILPGNTASSSCHKGELDYFGQNHHAVSPDFRGTGRSQRISSWSQDWWDKCTEDIASLISHLGKKQCVIIGTSGGANIALLFAIRYPEYVSGVIADSSAEIHSPERLRKEVSDRSCRTKEQVDFWTYAHGEDWEEVVSADNRLLLDLADRGGNIFKGGLKTVKCPVLFTGSLKDSFIHDIGEQNINMSKQIPNSRVFFVNEGDHPFMWSCPNVFRSVCEQFLKDLSMM